LRSPWPAWKPFVYRAALDGGLTEHELDHVFVGVADGDPLPDPAEVAEWRWIEISELERELKEQPQRFTAWFPIAFGKFLRHRVNT
jgi:isopentenyl-diphosphate delta-isomerase